MNILFMGAKQGGMIGLLSIMTSYDKIDGVVAYEDILKSVSSSIGIVRILDSINRLRWYSDLLVSVHGREIISNEILSQFKYGGINLHPMLSKYKGANPITRFINDSYQGKTDNIASVGVHRMTDVLDGGEILSEKFIEIDSPWEKSPVEIYNELYPLYPLVLMEAIQKVCG